MAGNINNLLLIFLLTVLNSCQNLKHKNQKDEVFLSIRNNVHYNADIVDYYVVNRTNKDIKILCNPNFFKRQKDSLFVNTWFNPTIKIYDGRNQVDPILLNVNYSSKILDSLGSIKEKYAEVDNLSNVSSQLNTLKKYFKTIKKHDSIKLSTKINFESEPRFYDLSENEGYILKKGKNYTLKICLNENINPKIISFLEKENVYLQEICSNSTNLIFVKTNYSE